MRALLGCLAAVGYVFALIVGAGVLHRAKLISHETSRKSIHIFLCFTWVILYRFFAGSWLILIVPIIFIVVNALSYKYKLFSMIEREGEGNHLGTVYFAVSMTVLLAAATAFPETLPMSGLGVFCLSCGDGFAAVAGQYIKSPRLVGKKTLAGTAACFVFSIVGMAVCTLFVPAGLNVWQLLVLAAVSAVAELAGKGLDNFTVPFSVYLTGVLLQAVCA